MKKLKNKDIKYSYYKLGKKASSFFDATSRLKLLPTVPGKIPTKLKSKMVREKSAMGHIIEINEKEYNEMMEAIPVIDAKLKTVKTPTPLVVEKIVNTPEKFDEAELEDMKVGPLRVIAVKYATDEKQVASLMKMKHEELVEFILGEQGMTSSEDKKEIEEEDEEDEDNDTTDEETDEEDTDDDDEDEEK